LKRSLAYLSKLFLFSALVAAISAHAKTDPLAPFRHLPEDNHHGCLLGLEFEFFPYIAANKRPEANALLNEALDFIGEYPRPRVAIDVGAGSGNETLELLRRGWEVVAIDGAASSIETIRRRSSRINRDFKNHLVTYLTSFQNMELPEDSADLIYSYASLPYLTPENFERVFTKLSKTLKSGGYFVTVFADQKNAPHDTGTFLSRREIRSLVKRNGLELEALDSFDYPDPNSVDRYHKVRARKL
jgi:tellurite methyltransferase